LFFGSIIPILGRDVITELPMHLHDPIAWVLAATLVGSVPIAFVLGRAALTGVDHLSTTPSLGVVADIGSQCAWATEELDGLMRMSEAVGKRQVLDSLRKLVMSLVEWARWLEHLIRVKRMTLWPADAAREAELLAALSRAVQDCENNLALLDRALSDSAPEVGS
jgi:hypothetical protein